MMRYKGWYGESYRHSLAARGYRLGFVADPTFIAINEATNLRRMQNVMPSSYMPPAELPAETPEQVEARVREADIYFEQRAADMERLKKIDALLKDYRMEKLRILLENASPEKVQDMLARGTLTIQDMKNMLTQKDIDFYKKNMYLLYPNAPGVDVIPGSLEMVPSEDAAIALEKMYSKYPPERFAEEFAGMKMVPSLGSLRSQYLRFEGPSAPYPVYGEGRSPFVPYWYGRPEEMTAEQSLARFNYLKSVKEAQIFKRLASGYPILQSNWNPVEKEKLISKLRSDARAMAESELLEDLGVYNMPWPERFKGMEPSGRELAEAYPEIKQLAFKRFQTSPKIGVSGIGSLNRSRATSSNYYEFVDPFTGSTKTFYYKPGVIDRKTFDYTPDPSEKRVDTAIANKERQWKGFLGYLQSKTQQSGYKGEGIPMQVKDINQAARWLKENKYPKANVDDLRESLVELGQKYLGTLRQQKEREQASKSKIVRYEPAANYRDKLRQVYSGGAIFDTPQAAQVLVNDARRAGINFAMNKVKQDDVEKWAVVPV